MSCQILTNVYFIGIGIPLILIGLGALSKKLVRAGRFQRNDFYLGVELTLVSLASAFLYFFELMRNFLPKTESSAAPFTKQLALTGFFFLVTFFMLLVVIALHQSWEQRDSESWPQFLVLGIISNLIGGILLFSFVIIIRGG